MKKYDLCPPLIDYESCVRSDIRNYCENIKRPFTLMEITTALDSSVEYMHEILHTMLNETFAPFVMFGPWYVPKNVAYTIEAR